MYLLGYLEHFVEAEVGIRRILEIVLDGRSEIRGVK